jgi:hypothetical protein
VMSSRELAITVEAASRPRLAHERTQPHPLEPCDARISSPNRAPERCESGLSPNVRRR